MECFECPHVPSAALSSAQHSAQLGEARDEVKQRWGRIKRWMKLASAEINTFYSFKFCTNKTCWRRVQTVVLKGLNITSVFYNTKLCIFFSVQVSCSTAGTVPGQPCLLPVTCPCPFSLQSSAWGGTALAAGLCWSFPVLPGGEEAELWHPNTAGSQQSWALHCWTGEAEPVWKHTWDTGRQPKFLVFSFWCCCLAGSCPALSHWPAWFGVSGLYFPGWMEPVLVHTPRIKPDLLLWSMQDLFFRGENGNTQWYWNHPKHPCGKVCHS